jgi:two-component system, sensor histidine kinase and response regulator
MDCHMPGMDGFETASEIRRRENGRARTPIIALTASTAAEYRARCLDAGMDDFLTKPIELDTMQTILSRWIVP